MARLKHAKTMLSFYKKDHKISDIAVKCGFLDFAYFSKAFKKYAGISPSEYQQRYARDEEYDNKVMSSSGMVFHNDTNVGKKIQ